MTVEEKEKLFGDVDSLLEIYKKHDPINAIGKFTIEEVKATTIEMLDFIVEDKIELENLKNWMNTHDFWASPASARYHGNVKGGLAAHSLLVAKQALSYAKMLAENFMESKNAEKFSFTAEEVLLAAVAHDFCKAGSYSTESRKTKDYMGNWTYETYYKVRSDWRNLGHGNESVLLLLESMPSLIKKRHVIEAVSRHMGFSDLSDIERMNYSNFLQNPLVVLIQIADETAAQWWDL